MRGILLWPARACPRRAHDAAMTIPPRLQAGIDEIVSTVPAAALEGSARALSESYRGGGPAAARAARSATDVAAYLATRAPATYAAVEAVVRQIELARPGWAPGSVLDLGAGPGIASWAALAAWPEIEHVTLVEAEPEMVRAGTALAAEGPEAMQRARWEVTDASSGSEQADLVIASYLIGELDPAAVGRLRRASLVAGDGHARDRRARHDGGLRARAGRARAGARGGRIDAGTVPPRRPVPAAPRRLVPLRRAAGAEQEPSRREGRRAQLRGREVRVRRAGAGSRGRRRQARIIRRPEQNPGHVVFSLCTDDGLERRTVSRKQKDAYRDARKRAWGDPL